VISKDVRHAAQHPDLHRPPAEGRVTAMLRADELTVVHHDDTTSKFVDVTYALDRDGLRVITAGGDETAFPGHDVLTTHVRLTHQRRPRTDPRATDGRLAAGA
jgi:hypothetical protein